MSLAYFMKKQGYKYLYLKRITRGDYAPRDSEWNYSDIPHLNYIHTKVDAYTYFADNDRIVNLFMQRLGPFSVPVSNYIEHLDKDKHSYVMNILGMVVSVTTTHKKATDGKAETLTEYKFYYRSLIEKLIAFVIKNATKKNYKILMSEDKPMRNQRGFLRNIGMTFLSDKKDKIGFSETEDLNIKNVNGRFYFQGKKQLKIDLRNNSNNIHIKDWHLTLISFDNKISILGDICQHEGANLTYEFSSKLNTCLAACPWHGKRVSPLLILNKYQSGDHIFNYLHQEFEASIKNDVLYIKVI